MKRKVFLIATGLLLAAAVWLLIEHWPTPAGPVYQGKTATQWLSECYTPNRAHAMEAFRQMGSNAVPFLVHELQRTNSAWARFYVQHFGSFPMTFRRHVPLPIPDIARWNVAEAMLINLPARTAVPDLTRLLVTGNNEQQLAALRLLMNFARPADTNCVPPLLNCLSSTNHAYCIYALATLKRIGPGREAIPALTNLLNGPPSIITYQARDLLEQIDPKTARRYKMTYPQQPSETNSQPDLREK